MPQNSNATSSFIEEPPDTGKSLSALRVLLSRAVVVIGLIIILIFVIVSVFAPQLAPHEAYGQNLKECLLQPGQNGHILGTDALGRDILSRIIYGSRTSLMIGLVSVFISASLGMTLGMIAGFYGGTVNTIIMRFIDAIMAIPMILLALVIAALLGGGLNNVMLAIGLTMTSVYARMMCGQVLSIKENDYITAERSIGASSMRIILRHLLPNCFPPLIVIITMQMGAAILAEAGLSFLGVGIEPPGAAWGAMVNDGYQYLLDLPILSIAPGVAIMLVVFAFNMVGDGLRDALDPRLRGAL